jgi:hypothetical protein
MEELASRERLREYIIDNINDNEVGGITAEEVRKSMLGIIDNSMRVYNEYKGNKVVVSNNEGYVVESDYTTAELKDALDNIVVYTAGEGIDIIDDEISIKDGYLEDYLLNNYTQLNPDNLSIDSTAKTFCAHPFRVNEEAGEGEDPITENNLAEGNFSTAFGFSCKAHNGASNSFVAGDKCEVFNEDCFVAGEGLKTAYDHQTIFGKYNVDGNYNSWGNKKPIFFIGGGSSNTNRATLLAQQGNNGDLCCAGGFANNAGFDFAEYFEWADGNQDGKDRIGYMVQLVMEYEKDEEGNLLTDANGNNIPAGYNKIEFATSFDNCIGVTTSTYGFVCDSQVLDWQGKYVKDAFGRPELDEDGNLQISENYDASQEYVPREFRQEWTPVGMMGKILTKQDGSLVVGGYAVCDNGVATYSEEGGYRVLKIISEKVALLLFK